MKKIKNIYREMKKSYLGGKAALLPEKYWSQFVCVGAASDWHYLLERTIPKDKKKVLIVGVHGGRDYLYFKTAGYDVVGFDLFPDEDFGKVIIGNIEDAKLPDKSFDVIVASAIIEHVDDDYAALKNIRRILKNDGIFVIGIPFYNDWEITHMHIYSRESIRRLLKVAGFSVDQAFEYPNLFVYAPIANFLLFILNFFFFVLSGRTFYGAALPPFWKLEFFLSRQLSLPFRVFRSVAGWLNNGVFTTLICQKMEVFDQADFNKGRFEPHS
ncbi:MAG: class I SAM-dependent methyltransferase [Patescibacteria group bacterium]